MSETQLWSKLKRLVLEQDASADLQRHEDRLSLGTPDVSYGILGVGGWVELKSLDHWPADSSSPVPFPNLKPHQRVWLRRRGASGVPTYLLFEVKRSREYGLVRWNRVEDLGYLPRRQLVAACDGFWRTQLTPKLVRLLRTP